MENPSSSAAAATLRSGGSGSGDRARASRDARPDDRRRDAHPDERRRSSSRHACNYSALPRSSSQDIEKDRKEKNRKARDDVETLESRFQSMTLKRSSSGDTRTSEAGRDATPDARHESRRDSGGGKVVISKTASVGSMQDAAAEAVRESRRERLGLSRTMSYDGSSMSEAARDSAAGQEADRSRRGVSSTRPSRAGDGKGTKDRDQSVSGRRESRRESSRLSKTSSLDGAAEFVADEVCVCVCVCV